MKTFPEFKLAFAAENGQKAGGIADLEVLGRGEARAAVDGKAAVVVEPAALIHSRIDGTDDIRGWRPVAHATPQKVRAEEVLPLPQLRLKEVHNPQRLGPTDSAQNAKKGYGCCDEFHFSPSCSSRVK